MTVATSAAAPQPDLSGHTPVMAQYLQVKF